jgi:hypothetical protein
MKPNSPISLGSSNLQRTIDNLRGKDTVKLKNLMTDAISGETVVFVKPGGGSRVLGFLSSKSQREKNATAACKKIDAVFFSSSYDKKLIDSVKKNIRDQITKTGCLTGDFLSRNLEALRDQKVLVRKDEITS